MNCSTSATGRLWSGACAFFDLCAIYPRFGGDEQERRSAAFVREHAIGNPQRLVEAIKIVLGQKLAFDLVDGWSSRGVGPGKIVADGKAAV